MLYCCQGLNCCTTRHTTLHLLQGYHRFFLKKNIELLKTIAFFSLEANFAGLYFTLNTFLSAYLDYLYNFHCQKMYTFTTIPRSKAENIQVQTVQNVTRKHTLACNATGGDIMTQDHIDQPSPRPSAALHKHTHTHTHMYRGHCQD